MNRSLAITATALSWLYFFAAPCLAQSKATVQCPVSVDVPSIVTLTGEDLVTTSQNLSLNASNITFDANLTAKGKSSVTWRGNTNANNGFLITVQRSAITGTAGSSMQGDLLVSGSAAGGGDTDVVVAGAYAAGVPLNQIPEATPAEFCKTTGPGSANFEVNLNLNAPSNHGKGTVQTVLTFIGASL